MSGVLLTQHPPPGWLTSTSPSKLGVFGSSAGSIGVDVAIVTPLRITSTMTGPSLWLKPWSETKSRWGNEMSPWPGGGTAAPAGTANSAAALSAAAVVIVARVRLRAPRAPSLVLLVTGFALPRAL
jgi:hypothetical protein